jgi:hypothetical protein
MNKARIILLALSFWFALMHLTGCTNPNAPTNCLDASLEATYEKLEGVRAGDPNYEEAVRWSSICPKWGLLSE